MSAPREQKAHDVGVTNCQGPGRGRIAIAISRIHVCAASQQELYNIAVPGNRCEKQRGKSLSIPRVYIAAASKKEPHNFGVAAAYSLYEGCLPVFVYCINR